jgi:AbrB family looped-hinge helix DNA binding protein
MAKKGICIHDRIFYGMITVSEKGQIALPIELRRDLEIKTGDRFLVVKRRDISESITAEEVLISASDTSEETNVVQEDSTYESLLTSAQEIRKNENVLGYILRGENNATVDLNEPSRIVEYAMLASQAFESSERMVDTFNLGKTRNVIVEGQSAKALCANLDRNKLCVFMKKTADHSWLLDLLF